MQFHWELSQGSTVRYLLYYWSRYSRRVVHATGDPKRLIELPTGRQGLDYDSHLEQASTKVDQYSTYRSMAMRHSTISYNHDIHAEHSWEYGMRNGFRQLFFIGIYEVTGTSNANWVHPDVAFATCDAVQFKAQMMY